MLEEILKMYTMYMGTDVRSPLPHLVGPPGCGKSTSVEQAADILDVNLHVVNVSRLSPLEIEGVQMPVTMNEGDMHLKMLTATFWTNLKEGDILLLDEFLRGFPEVYNGLLDILTSRRVGNFVLPKVFIIAASNSTISYDKALGDRLLHLPVPDPRKRKGVRKEMAQLIVDELGLHPDMVTASEMQSLLDNEVLPMFEMLDALKAGTPTVNDSRGRSIRNLIGQAQLRQVESSWMKELLDANNQRAHTTGKHHFVFLYTGKSMPPGYAEEARDLASSPQTMAKIKPIQATNLALNLQLIELEAQKKKETKDDDIDDDIFLDLE